MLYCDHCDCSLALASVFIMGISACHEACKGEGLFSRHTFILSDAQITCSDRGTEAFQSGDANHYTIAPQHVGCSDCDGEARGTHSSDCDGEARGTHSPDPVMRRPEAHTQPRPCDGEARGTHSPDPYSVLWGLLTWTHGQIKRGMGGSGRICGRILYS